MFFVASTNLSHATLLLIWFVWWPFTYYTNVENEETANYDQPLISDIGQALAKQSGSNDEPGKENNAKHVSFDVLSLCSSADENESTYRLEACDTEKLGAENDKDDFDSDAAGDEFL